MSASKNIILVTGANSGIGFEVAAQLLPDASNHILLGARSVEKGEAAVKELQSRKLPGTVELVQIDLSSEDSIAAAAKAVESKHGRLDALVNNAAVASTGAPLPQEMVDCFRINAVGTQLTTDSFVPLLRKAASGTPRIVNVSSGGGSIARRLADSGLTASIKATAYRVSKAAMNFIAANHAFELRDEGFKVFIYCPGYTVSNLSEYNTADKGAKPTSEGAKPIIDILKGDRDAEAEKFLNSAGGEFPW